MEYTDSEGLVDLQKIATDFSCIDQSCIFAHIETADNLRNEELNMIQHRMCGCSIFLMVVSGTMSISYNYEHYDITGPSILSIPDGTTLQIIRNGTNNIDLYMLVYSKRYLQEINISLTSISGQALLDYDSPVLSLQDRETGMTLKYFKLIHSVMQDTFNLQLNRHIVANLSAALFYQMLVLLYKRVETNTQVNTSQRRSNYVRQFFKLVHLNYTHERNVAFYASKLFISPKYLSLLVKEATGRSAVRWIDHFVIMEAKNLLRYSGKNIQQVAYALNFSNQSSFGKYFKHITGMSPTEFQKNS